GRSHAGLPTAGRNRQDHPEEAAHLLNDYHFHTHGQLEIAESKRFDGFELGARRPMSRTDLFLHPSITDLRQVAPSKPEASRALAGTDLAGPPGGSSCPPFTPRVLYLFDLGVFERQLFADAQAAGSHSGFPSTAAASSTSSST